MEIMDEQHCVSIILTCDIIGQLRVTFCQSNINLQLSGPMAWNALPDDLRDPSLSADNFRKGLKTHLFRNALGHSAH